jgi:hypothetical protein
MSASAPAPASNATELDSRHCRAICEEIGERLALVLRPVTSELPPRLKELIAQLALLDHDAPSIAPSIEEIGMPEETSLPVASRRGSLLARLA